MDAFAIEDVPRAGAENMALDQCLLEASAARNCIIVRTYEWLEPTLSLGYFQRFNDRQSAPQAQGLATVRRATGGGAIVHHHEWTYSVATPALSSHPTSSSQLTAHSLGATTALYDCIHDGVVDWLCQLGYPARKWTRQCSTEDLTSVPTHDFLCFQRRSCGDVVVGPHKILGSAQRRYRGATLQHGSLLLENSPYAPQLAGLMNIQRIDEAKKSANLVKTQFMAMLIKSMANNMDLEFRTVEPSELVTIEELASARNRFHDSAWTQKL
jgi:lipoate-protein ligase A